MRTRYWLAIGITMILVVIGIWAVFFSAPPAAMATIASPSNLHFVPPNTCAGTYDNGVAVAWPAVGGIC